MVPRSMLREWALHALPNATDYWTFRKVLTIQLALIGFAEFVLHLNRLNPEMLQIAQVRGAYSLSSSPSPASTAPDHLLFLSGHWQAECRLLPL